MRKVYLGVSSHEDKCRVYRASVSDEKRTAEDTAGVFLGPFCYSQRPLKWQAAGVDGVSHQPEPSVISQPCLIFFLTFIHLSHAQEQRTVSTTDKQQCTYYFFLLVKRNGHHVYDLTAPKRRLRPATGFCFCVWDLLYFFYFLL